MNENIEIKCEVCGKVFHRLSNITRHIAMSRTHPSISEYCEKYLNPDSDLRKYNSKHKGRRKGNIPEILEDRSKIFDVKGSIADMGLSNVHSIVAINSMECSLDFIRLLTSIFTRTNVHLCIMGPDASKFKDKIPEGLTTSLLIDSVAFNYSLAINILLKPIYEEFPMAKVVICDGWNIFSSIQVIKKEMANVDWDNEFVRLNTVFDYEKDPINFNMDPGRLSSSVLNRLRNMNEFNYYVPIIICRVKYLLDLESGLEEDLFTEYSRNHLRNQLVTAGLIEKVCEENKGLCIRPRMTVNKIEQKDSGIINKIEPRMNNFIFIPSNYKIDFGDSNRIKQIVIDKNIPVWNHLKYKKPLSKIYGISDKKKDVVTSKDIKTDVDLVDLSKNLNSKHKVLLLVGDNIRDIITSTPLIRGLYEKFGEIDILTRDKLNPTSSLLQNYMVRKIFDINDLNNKFLSLKQYGPNIIKTIGCKINKLNKLVDVIEPINVYSNLADTNYSIIDPYILNLPKPYCNVGTSKSLANMLTVAISVNTDFYTNTKLWDCLEIIGSRSGNNRNINVCFLSLSGERKLFLTDRFKIRKNFHILDNFSPIKASSIINNSRLFLTTSDTQLSWLSWGLNTTTFMLNIISEIPERNNEKRFTIEDRSSKIDIDKIMSDIWKVL